MVTQCWVSVSINIYKISQQVFIYHLQYAQRCEDTETRKTRIQLGNKMVHNNVLNYSGIGEVLGSKGLYKDRGMSYIDFIKTVYC